MEFRILGPLEALDDGREIRLQGTKPRALLAVLLMRANQVVAADELIDALWGERPPETAAKTLQTYVSQVRKAFPGNGSLLVTRPGGYSLCVEPDAIDVN